MIYRLKSLEASKMYVFFIWHLKLLHRNKGIVVNLLEWEETFRVYFIWTSLFATVKVKSLVTILSGYKKKWAYICWLYVIKHTPTFNIHNLFSYQRRRDTVSATNTHQGASRCIILTIMSVFMKIRNTFANFNWRTAPSVII